MVRTTMLALKRLKDGDHAVMDGDNQVGVIGHKHLMEHARACMDDLAQLSSRPIPGELPVDQEVRAKVQRAIREDFIGYSKALRKVLAADRGLSERYYAAHRQELRETAAPRQRTAGGERRTSVHHRLLNTDAGIVE